MLASVCQVPSPPKITAPSCWTPPLQGFLKPNFDGAAKGNPGKASLGNIFLNEGGETINPYAGKLDHTNNNVVKLSALEEDLIIATQNDYSKNHSRG